MKCHADSRQSWSAVSKRAGMRDMPPRQTCTRNWWDVRRTSGAWASESFCSGGSPYAVLVLVVAIAAAASFGVRSHRAGSGPQRGAP